MGIQNFPAALVPIIQTNMLEREFRDGLTSRLAYRAVADRETFAAGIGETLTKTRRGLKAAATTPLVASANTNTDNGLSASGYGVEQYTVTINQYADTMDLNMVTSRVGIVDQFLSNAKVNGIQAAQTLDQLARNALFSTYLGGNTRVRTTLVSAGQTISVDDVRGFQYVFVNGVQTAVSNSNPITVTIGSNSYSIGAVAVDASNVSTAPKGVSGTLTTVANNISTADGTAGNAVVASTAPTILRAGSKATTAALTASDTLTMSKILDGVAALRINNVPGVGGGAMYNCYLDPQSARQLFSDSDFRQLFQGVGINATFAAGRLESEFLGVRMVPTTEAYVQAVGSVNVRRPIICGQGALIEGDYDAMGYSDVATADSIMAMVDGVAMVTREPLDRLQQIIAQSWYWIGGFAVPSDTTVNSTYIPTATNAAFKRAVVIEHGS